MKEGVHLPAFRCSANSLDDGILVPVGIAFKCQLQRTGCQMRISQLEGNGFQVASLYPT